MKLLNLNLRNFKGIKHFDLNAGGENIDVFGDNATGKTTLFDAFTWLLFDKDSSNRKDFEIKTLDRTNQPVHGLDHEVKAVLEIDGRVITLHKAYKEKWTKKRGAATPEFTGHTTDYFIDGVPAKKGEYEARIAEIADENIFKLLTSPTYFNEQIHWQDRRKILLEVCGDISDEEVIVSDSKLSKLPEILNGRSLEDHKKVIAAKRAAINKELEKIPVRIDEVEQGLPELSGLNAEKIAADIENLRDQIREKEQELSRIEDGGEIAEKRVQLREVESDLISLRNQLQGKISEQIDAKRREHQQIKSKIYDLQFKAKNKKGTLDHNQQQIKQLETEMSKLREEWHQVNDQKFTFEQDDTCPTCGQALPVDQLEQARAKALAAFNRDKADRLESITVRGKECKEQVESFQAELQLLDDAIEKAESRVKKYTQKAADIELLIENTLKDANAYQEAPAYIKKLAEKEALEAETKRLQQDNTEAVNAVKTDLETLNVALMSLQASQARVYQVKQGQARIKELKAKERELATEYERLESELYLTEEFIRTKVQLLEERINSKFKLARFKLFDVQVNGGVVECCETLYQGVPYSGGLNNGHRNAVGMDIINTLSEHYGLYPPIFVDNAESITVLPEMEAQVIRLIVSEKDKALRVEAGDGQETLFKEVV